MDMDMLANLIDRHFFLFQGKTPPCSRLREGWYPLADALCTELESTMSLDELDAFHIRQITEEIGMLRIHRAGIRQIRVEQLIDTVEEISALTCSDCGSPGRLRKGNQFVTLCDFCEDERQIRATRYRQSRSIG